MVLVTAYVFRPTRFKPALLAEPKGRAVAVLLAASIAIVSFGCGTNVADLPAIEGLRKKVTEQVGDAAGAAKAMVKGAGSVELDVNGPVKASKCAVELIKLGEGRPAILQIANTVGQEAETFPSIFVRAEVTAASLADLSGRRLSGQFFAQSQSGGPISFTTPDRPIEIFVKTATNDEIEVELTGALETTGEGAAPSVKGTVKAVVP